MDIIENIKMNNFLHPACEGKIYNREDYILDHSLNKERVNEYIDLFKDEFQPEIHKLFKEVIQHISWNEFKENLLTVAEETLSMIKGNDFKFVIPNDIYKSNYFFTAIVNEEIFIPNEKFAKEVSDVLVVVDDMSYSGSQLFQLLDNFSNIKLNSTSGDIKLTYMKRLAGIDNYTRKFSKSLNPDDYILMGSNRDFYLITKDESIELQRTIDNVFKILPLIKGKKFVSLEDENIGVSMYIDSKSLSLEHKIIILGIPYISNIVYENLQKFNKIHSGGLYSSVEVKIPKNVIKVPNLSEYDLDLDLDNFFPFVPLDDLTGVYFDHKLASPVSTVSIILGCGIVPKDFSKSVKVEKIGNLLKNCSKDYYASEEVQQFAVKYYEDFKSYNTDDEKLCINCPKAIYKYKNCDFKSLETAKELRDKIGYSFCGYIGNKTILIEE